MQGFGLIQVYTGNGKGKTTAALGLALRAAGHGFKVAMIQFMKENTEYGEFRAAAFLPGFTLLQVGRNDFVDAANPDPVDIRLARDGWEIAKKMIMDRQHRIVILDEINVAMAWNLLDTDAVANFLTSRPGDVEIVLTGRYAPKVILDMADLVTEMREIRHPYQAGIEGRKGIDY